MKPAIAIFLVMIAIIGSLKILSPAKPSIQGTTVDSPDLILYWEEGCSHCENLKRYITDNKIEEKLKITYKQVHGNESNLNDLEETIKLCPEIDPSKGIGVPFTFFTLEKKCILGDTPAIDKIERMIKWTVVKKSKKKEYHFSFQTVIRLLIFLAIIYLIITTISAQKFHLDSEYDSTVLGEEVSSSSAQLFFKNTLDSAYEILPPQSREIIKDIDKNPVVITLQEKFDYIRNESADFPQRQIKEIKKAIINSIYRDMIKNIDSGT